MNTPAASDSTSTLCEAFNCSTPATKHAFEGGYYYYVCDDHVTMYMDNVSAI